MKISVVTAVRNARDSIVDAIESVIQQTHPDIDPVVIDGASTDGTRELLEGYVKRIGTLISEPDHGIYDALNKGLANSVGDVVGFLHADDLFANNQVLSRIAEAFSDPSVDAIYGDLVYVNKYQPGKVVRYWRTGEYSLRKLKFGWMPPHPTFYVRKSVYDQFGVFDTGFRIAADYDCMLRFLGQGEIKCRYIPEVLVKMRVGGASNRSLKNILRKSVEDYRALRMNQIGGMETLLLKNLSKLPQFLLREN